MIIARIARAAIVCSAGVTAACAAAPDPLGAGAAAAPCDPVIMVIAGETLDAERMAAYSAALERSGLYPALGGYYLNAPRPVAVFEGDPPEDYVSLMVRFPSLEAARAFWADPVYQSEVKPLRLSPPAGDYTVTVYREIDAPDYMTGRLAAGGYARCGPDE